MEPLATTDDAQVLRSSCGCICVLDDATHGDLRAVPGTRRFLPVFLHCGRSRALNTGTCVLVRAYSSWIASCWLLPWSGRYNAWCLPVKISWIVGWIQVADAAFTRALCSCGLVFWSTYDTAHRCIIFFEETTHRLGVMVTIPRSQVQDWCMTGRMAHHQTSRQNHQHHTTHPPTPSASLAVQIKPLLVKGSQCSSRVHLACRLISTAPRECHSDTRKTTLLRPRGLMCLPPRSNSRPPPVSLRCALQNPSGTTGP